MPTAKLLVANLDSADSEKELESCLRHVSGVYGVVASRRDRCIEVDFEDDEVKLDQIVAAAGAAGFNARLAG